MSFKEYKSLDLIQISDDVLSFWDKDKTFEKSISSRNDSKRFVFFEGPPSANGKPGIHHVMARALKDIFCRYKTLKGFKVERKAGWDTHGLPIELGVEKQLGISKEDIGTKISIEDYNKSCKDAVMKYTNIWNDLTRKIGYWVDMENPYVTYKSKYIESVWWLLKELHEKGLIYKGYSIQPYSPKAGTGLSSHELNQPGTYQDITDTTVTAQFKCIEKSLPEFLKKYGSVHILAWTTTPWTLPSNTALTVGANIDYVIIKTFNQYTEMPVNVILAKNLIGKVLKNNYKEVNQTKELIFSKNNDIPFFISEHFKGRDLINIKYEKLWADSPLPTQNPENAFRVISGDFVTTDEGTGIVHTAPTFGADDMIAAQNAKPEVPPMLILDKDGNLSPLVDLQGKFIEGLGSISGKYVKNQYYNEKEVPEKSVDVEIAIKLKEENKAFRVEKYTHSYPNCWRTDKPILYYPLNSWFISVTKKKDDLIRNNNKINWKPKSTGSGRFGNWLENANDWNLSRSRYWGIPLPIWCSEDGKEILVIGSVKELYTEIEKSIQSGFMKQNPFSKFVVDDFSESNYEKIDLHKHVVDKIILVSKSNKPLYREADLLDVWFDSGSMPYAQWHYPFENKEMIDMKSHFPADYIAEGVDQTRGWFYTLHVISTLIFNSISYKNVISNGLVLDKNGQKMSKRLGNAVDPFETLEKYGPDATRWYMISNSNPWENLKFDLNGIDEVRRKFFGTLYNIYAFFSLYSNIDGYTKNEVMIPYESRRELDRWIISCLNSLIEKVESAYTDYDPTKSSRLISQFVQDDLSNWYVRLSRRVFWKGEYNDEKISAFQTLHECLTKIAIISSPISPFYMDQLFQDLTNENKSVHLANFPKVDIHNIDSELEKKIKKSQMICSIALSIRKREKIKVRQPLNKVLIPFRSPSEKSEILEIEDFIKSEINVKQVELISDSSKILVKKAKPNFKSLGPKFGKNIQAVSKTILNMDGEQIHLLEIGETLNFEINNFSFDLSLVDIEVFYEDIEGWQVGSESGYTIALDISINDKLKNEGISREIVNKIQNLRKDSNFNVSDKIIINIVNNNLIDKALKDNLGYVKNETLAAEINFVDKLDTPREFEFDNIKLELEIKKIS